MSWYDYIPSPIFQAGNAASGGTPFGVSGSDITSLGYNPKNDQLHQMLTQQTQQASGFGQGLESGLGGLDYGFNRQLDFLRGVQNGQNSLAGEQLRQGLQQQLAQQQAMAASASPGNQAMAARNAANNMGRASYGMAGQAAQAAIQEKLAAGNALTQALLNARGQNIQGANQAYGTATQGAAAGVGNPYQSTLQQLAPIISAGSAAAGAMSDRRLKSDIKDGDEESEKILKGLKSYSFKYKDDRFGKGEQYGVMAQELERSGLGHAVVNTPAGKMVHAGKAATSALGLAAHLAKRVAKLEADED